MEVHILNFLYLERFNNLKDHYDYVLNLCSCEKKSKKFSLEHN